MSHGLTQEVEKDHFVFNVNEHCSMKFTSIHQNLSEIRADVSYYMDVDTDELKSKVIIGVLNEIQTVSDSLFACEIKIIECLSLYLSSLKTDK